jgi:hypothetical protein
VIKQQFGHAKVRHPGLTKQTARLTMLFALSHLWMVHGHILRLRGECVCTSGKALRGTPNRPQKLEICLGNPSISHFDVVTRNP